MPNSLYRMPLVYLFLTCVFCYSCPFLFVVFCVFVFFFCSHWSLVDVPLIFFCPADHVPDWQPRILLGMVEARSVNVKKTTTVCTIPLITMQGYHTHTEDTGSLGYNSVCYITSRIGWVSMRGIYRWYRCMHRRDPGKLYNNYCYTYLTKDQHPPSNLVVVQYSAVP